MVVGYAMPALSAMLMLSKGDTKWISLPNILAQKTLVPECLQMFCSPEILASHVLYALEPRRRDALVPVFEDMHASMLRDTGRLATDAISRVLEQKAR
jgi:lipid-A-disaccharide synthase